MNASNPAVAALKACLASTRERLIVLGAAAGALQVLGAAGLFLAAAFAADRLTLLPAALRAVAGCAFVIMAVAFLYAKSLAIFVRPPSFADAARTLEERFPQLGSFTLSAAQLALSDETRSSAPSDQLVQMTVEEAVRRGSGARPSEAVPCRMLAGATGLFLVAAAVWTAAVLLSGGDAAVFFRRFLDPFGPASYATRTRLVALEAPAVLPTEAPFEAVATAEGELPPQAVFRIRPARGRENRVYAPAEGSRYTCRLDRVGSDFAFRVEIGDAKSSEIPVSVVERPSVSSVRAEIRYPFYTGLGTAAISGGNVSAPAGSAVRILARFNKPVASAALDFASAAPGPGSLSNDATSAAFDFEVSNDDRFRFTLVDEHGFQNVDASYYSVRSQVDAKPSVVLTRPARDLTVIPGAVVTVEATASDDFAVTNMSLTYEAGRSGKTIRRGELQMMNAPAPGKSFSAAVRLDVSALGLEEGDVVTYFVKALDNLPSGAQEGRSVERKARVVSLAEKTAELEHLHRLAQSSVGDAVRRQEQARAAVAGGAVVPEVVN